MHDLTVHHGLVDPRIGGVRHGAGGIRHPPTSPRPVQIVAPVSTNIRDGLRDRPLCS